MVTVQELLTNLRSTLKPKGTLPLVRLHLPNHGFVDSELVDAAVDEFEALIIAGSSKLREPNALEKLAILLLTESIEQ